MNIKLFIVMGVPWTIEILATILRDYDELWYVSDFVNISQGILVFLIFVCKYKVWDAIQQRLGILFLILFFRNRIFTLFIKQKSQEEQKRVPRVQPL